MLLKNAFTYQIDPDVVLDRETIEVAIRDNPCPDLGPRSSDTGGFVPVAEDGDDIVWSIHVDGLILGVFQELFRKIPPEVIKREMDGKIKKIRREEGREVSRHERAEIRDGVIFDLMPKAFPQTKRFPFVLDMKNRMIWIDAGSSAKAELVLTGIRNALNGFAVTPPNPAISPLMEMTAWTHDPSRAPEGMTIGDRCQMKDPEAGGPTVTIKGLELRQEEVCAHLEYGLNTTKIAMIQGDDMEFTLDENLVLRSMKALDSMVDNVGQSEAESIRDAHLAHLTIQGAVIRDAVRSLHQHFEIASAASA